MTWSRKIDLELGLICLLTISLAGMYLPEYLPELRQQYLRIFVGTATALSSKLEQSSLILLKESQSCSSIP